MMPKNGIRRNKFDLSINVVLLLFARGKMSRSEMADEFGLKHCSRSLKRSWHALEKKDYVRLTGRHRTPDEHFIELLPSRYAKIESAQEEIVLNVKNQSAKDSVMEKLKSLLSDSGLSDVAKVFS